MKILTGPAVLTAFLIAGCGATAAENTIAACGCGEAAAAAKSKISPLP